MTRTQDVTDGLIAMTGVSPRAALAAARSLLAAGPGPRDASIAHQAAAIVRRDFGDVRAAIREFRLAVRLARAAADPEREADVLTSLGAALVMAGRTEAGLAELDAAAARARDGGVLGSILVRRGGSLYVAGRYEQAQADLRRAVALTSQAGEVIWEARARTAAALADLATGETARAAAGLTAAEALYAGSGQQLEIAYARHNRALVAFASGDLPGALRHLDDAAGRYAVLGVAVPDAALDRCAVLLAAGLTADALAAVETALESSPGTALGGRVAAAKRAELLLAAARTALAAGQYDQSAERAELSRSMFRAQHRERWRARAALVVLQARFLAGRPPGRLLPEARRTAARLGELRSDEALDAWLLAGRIALLGSLGPARLLELVVVDGDLHVLVCGGGRIRHLAEPAGQALAALADAGRRLDALLLGAARDDLGDGPVVVVPPGRLNAVPWALLPSLAGRAVTVAPSARSWLRARNTPPFGMEKVVLVSGPGLDAARAEVETLAAEYGRATVLAGRDASTARVLGAIDGAYLAHIAAHGVFRADSPMFSSLRLADGPMTVHDVERLGRAHSGSSCQAASRAGSPRPAPTSCSAWPAPCCRWAPRASSPP